MASSFAPRQEAVPFGWQKLSTDQQDIVRDVHRWLAGFMSKDSASGDSDGKKDNADFLPRIEFERDSNVLLIDGDRGTGKTSVLLTLLQTWRDALDPSSARLPVIEDAEIAPLVQQRRIIPLDILDMQPLSGHPTLLLQLAGRLYRVAERIAKNAGEQTHEYPQRTGGTFPPSLQKWRELARVVAIAQEDDPHLRRSQNNPEDFAIELECAELRRMHLREQWHAFVTELLTDVGNAKYSHLLAPYAPGADPVFIVPIDDADMNPERGVELLDLLRSLWHPRVVFLLTGDSALFRTLLINHYLAVCPKMPPSIARKLAHDVLDKVIPPAQRLRCQLAPNQAFYVLNGTPPSVLPLPIVERVERAALYEAFPRRWRVLVNLKQSLDGKQSTPVGVARELFEEAVRLSTLSQPDQDLLMSWCFKPARRGLGLRVDESAVTMQPVTAERGGLALDTRRAVSWNVSDGEQWSVAVRAEGTENSGGEGLPESIVQSLYLAASLASQPKPASAEPTKGEPTFTRVGRSLSVTNYDIIKSTFIITPIRYEFPWPTPEWVDPLDFYLFLQGWRDALGSQRGALGGFPGATQVFASQTAAIESLVSWWISALCSLADDGTIHPELWESPDSHRWQELGGRIAKLAKTPPSIDTPQKHAYERWARHDALLFTSKVCGLSRATRNQLLTGWLTELVSYIAGLKKDESYWILVNEAADGQIDFLHRASLSIRDASIEQQLDCAIRQISNTSWKLFAKKEENDTSPGEVSVEKFRRAIKDIYGDIKPIEEFRFAIQALEPESEGRLDDFDMNVRLLRYMRHSDAKSQQLRTEHYKAQLQNLLSQLKLMSVPEPLSVSDTETGINLWARAKNVGLAISWDVTRNLAELAESSDILAQLSDPMPAQDAWKAITLSFLASKASLGAAKVTPLIDAFLSRTQSSPMTFLSMREGETHELTPTQRIQTPDFRVTVSELPDALFIDQGQAAVAAELFVKFHDLVIDETDTQSESIDEPVWIEHLSVNRVDSSYRLPLPGWPSSVDLLLHAYAANKSDWLHLGIRPVADQGDWDPWTVFCGFLLNSCLAIRKRRNQYYIPDYVNSIRLRMKPEGGDSGFLEELYRSLSHTVADANDSRYAGRRARAVREWVNLAGPLFAAPETGMSSERAARWLRAWDRSPSNTDDPAACKRLSAFRLKRAQLSLGGETTPEKAREFLDGIDAKHPDHPWVRRIEALAKGTQSA